MNHPPPNLNEDLVTRWIDGQLTPEEAAFVEQAAAATPDLLREKHAAGELGTLLRQHLPVNLEPPSPEFFNSSIIEEIQLLANPVKLVRESLLPSWLRWIRQPWLAPLASAAAVAIAFVIWNHRPASVPPELITQTYTPDPKVVANAFYSKEAQATVIDLQNLDAVPDDREIKAFDVASAGPATPGEPLILFAANDSARPVLVLSKDARDTPGVTTVH